MKQRTREASFLPFKLQWCPLLPPTNTIENNPITVSKNLTKQTNSTEDKFQPRKVDNLRVAQWIFSTYQPFSIKYPNDRVRNDPPTRAFFWKYYSLKLHVTFCRTSRVISPKLCHALFSMSRVKSGEFCHGQCHALFWGSKSVTGYFSCHGRFFRKLARVSEKVSRGKKTLVPKV